MEVITIPMRRAFLVTRLSRFARPMLLCTLLAAVLGCSDVHTGGQFSAQAPAATGLGQWTYSGSGLVKAVNGKAQASPLAFGSHTFYVDPAYLGYGLTQSEFPSFGVGVLRFWDVAYWRLLEPHSGQFNWGKLDDIIGLAQKHGVSNYLFTFGDIPAWAATNPNDPCDGSAYGPGTCSPPQLAALDDFTTHLVQRYCGVINYYEPWNEPNFSRMWDGTDQQLLTVTQHIYKIVKNPANCGCTDGVCRPGGGTNPNKVLTPTISYPAQPYLNWLDSYLSTAGSTYQWADIASLHAYTQHPEDMLSLMPAYQAVLARHGLQNAEQWLTETSWANTSLGDADRVSWVMRAHLVDAIAGLNTVIWYAYDNLHYGTLWSASDKALAPAGIAYGTIESWMESSTLSQCSEYANGLWSCSLSKGGSVVGLVFWNTSSTPVSVPFAQSQNVSNYLDWTGAMHPVTGGELTVTSSPVLVFSGTQPPFSSGTGPS